MYSSICIAVVLRYICIVFWASCFPLYGFPRHLIFHVIFFWRSLILIRLFGVGIQIYQLYTDISKVKNHPLLCYDLRPRWQRSIVYNAVLLSFSSLFLSEEFIQILCTRKYLLAVFDYFFCSHSASVPLSVFQVRIITEIVQSLVIDSEREVTVSSKVLLVFFKNF